MKFWVMACTDEEYKKANRIPGYDPEEYEVDSFEVDTEYLGKLRWVKGIKSNKYPKNSRIHFQK